MFGIGPQSVVIPQWETPPTVRSAITTRLGGVSKGNFQGFNLADHVGDQLADVADNRRALAQYLGLESDIGWLKQVHGTRVVTLEGNDPMGIEADAAYTACSRAVCIVLTADCLPILLCNMKGDKVAAIHAGWRGLVRGILPVSVRHFNDVPENLMAYIGPGISQECFEVGAEVRDAFFNSPHGLSHQSLSKAFAPGVDGHFFADLVYLAYEQLKALGVASIDVDARCTHKDTTLYSYRRDGETGRFASLIWIES